MSKPQWVPMHLSKLQIRAPMLSQQHYAQLKSMASLAAPLPKEFNWATSKHIKINPPQDQGQCGTCWAVSTASAIGDKWAIASKQHKSTMLAVSNLTNCVVGGSCMEGGYPSDAALFATDKGLVPQSCWEYSCSCEPATDVESLQPRCTSSPPHCERVFLKSGSVRAAVVLKAGVAEPKRVTDIDVPATQDLIKTHIFHYGPVVSAFAVPGELMNDIPSDPNYIFLVKGGLNAQGGHAVKLVGWGEDKKGHLYWVMENSWGTNWANNGYIKMYAYPKNNFGLDIPMFKTSPAFAELFSTGSAFGDDKDVGGFGGVTIYEVDLKRSPKVAPSSTYLTANGDGTTSWSTNRKALLLIGVGLLVGGVVMGVVYSKKRNTIRK
jgi:hypothetical protein